MVNHTRLTASLEDYLKAIYFLHQADRTVRLVDIAERMSVSKPSVCHAVSQLSNKGFIEHIKFGPVQLTAYGIEAAQSLVAKHETIKLFLMRMLNIGEALACLEACAIEHTIHDITLNQMASLM